MSLFIVLEGIDGAGKTTQSFLLEKWFKEKKKKVYVTREPTDGLIGGIIRSALTKKLKLDPRTLQILFAADRSEHVREIQEKLKSGYVVICDRYFYSSVAYGMVDMSKHWLININSVFPKPHVTILLDLPARIAVRRLEARFSKTIFEKIDFLEKVRRNFLELRKHFRNYYVVDARGNVQEVHQKILKLVSRYVKP